MPVIPGLIQPVWNRIAGRFRDLATGRFLSAGVAAPLLRSSGGAFRDALGRFIPNRFLGGVVTRQWPTGAGNIAAVTRKLTVPPSEHLYRSGDIATAKVPYLHPELGRQVTDVTMPKGIPFDDDIYQERLSRRLVRVRADDTPELTEMPPILEDEIEWEVTTQYGEGEYLGGEIARFEG